MQSASPIALSQVPGDAEAAPAFRQCPVFAGVGCQFMNRQGEGLHEGRSNPDRWTLEHHASTFGRPQSIEFEHEKRAQGDGLLLGLRQKPLHTRERLWPVIERLRKASVGPASAMVWRAIGRTTPIRLRVRC